MATKRWKKWLLWLLVLTPVCYAAVVYWRIVNQSAHDESRTADAIVVFGAAEYDGRPSPVYKARLDRAAQLFQHGFAPIVITTGGSTRTTRELLSVPEMSTPRLKRPEATA